MDEPEAAAVVPSAVSVTVKVTLNGLPTVEMGLLVDFRMQLFGAVNVVVICAGWPTDVQFTYGGIPPVAVTAPAGSV